MKVFIALLAAVGLALGQECPAWNPWRPKSDCLWMENEGKLSAKDMMRGFINACGITLSDGKTIDDLPDLPIDLPFPDKCGHCAFRVECRNRQGMDQGCFPIDTKKEVCNEFADVCDMPEVPVMGGCEWAMMGAVWAQCTTTRPDLPEWKREGFKKGSKFFPQQNCIKKEGGGCSCCCHPYKPNADGTQCVKMEEPTCPDFPPMNDWTECLWWPPQALLSKVHTHCWGAANKKLSTALGGFKLPEGFEVPEKCGFCSFKIRCSKRNSKRPCFPVKADKIACGADDCPTCGDVCTMPQMGELAGTQYGQCDWNKFMLNIIKLKAKKMFKKAKNYWMKRGIKQIAQYIPHGTCKEVGDKCKCCCHPYQPSEDGTQCVLKDMCKLPSDMGFNWGVEN